MKNLIDILGGGQRLLGLNFDPDILFEERPTPEHRGFLTLLCAFEEHLPPLNMKQSRFGRPRCDDLAILRAVIAKPCCQIDKNNFLRQRMLSDSSLRRICGFTKVPSEATFSRRLKDFTGRYLPEEVLAKLVRQYHEGKPVRVVARDSTTVPGWKKAFNK